MNRIKKLLTVVLSIALIATLFAGCTKNDESLSASSFGDVYKTISEMKQYDYSTKIEIESDDPETVPNMEIELYGTNDGDNASLSVDVSVSGIKFSFEDVVIMSEDEIYVNVGEVMDKLGNYLALAGIDTSEYVDSDTKWISIPSIDRSNLNVTDLQTSIAGYIDEILADMDVSEDDGTYTFKIKDKEALVKFISALKDCLEKNGDSFAEAYSKAVSADDIEELMTKYMELAADTMEKMKSEYDLDISDEDMITDDMINEALGEMGLDSLEEDTKTQISDAITEFTAALDEAITEIENSEEDPEFSIKMSAGCSGDTATTEMNFSVTEEENTFEISITNKVTSNSDASVDVPSESVKELSDVLPAIAYYFYTSNTMLDSVITDDYDDFDYDDFDYDEDEYVTETAVQLEEPGVAPIKLDDRRH